MEIIGRRWTIFYAMSARCPGCLLMMMAHRAGPYATSAMVTGALITGFTALSTATAFRVYLVGAVPNSRLRGRGHIFGELVGRVFSGGDWRRS